MRHGARFGGALGQENARSSPATLMRLPRRVIRVVSAFAVIARPIMRVVWSWDNVVTAFDDVVTACHNVDTGADKTETEHGKA